MSAKQQKMAREEKPLSVLLNESRRWLFLHGMLTDAENQRVLARLQLRAKVRGPEEE